MTCNLFDIFRLIPFYFRSLRRIDVDLFLQLLLRSYKHAELAHLPSRLMNFLESVDYDKHNEVVQHYTNWDLAR